MISRNDTKDSYNTTAITSIIKWKNYKMFFKIRLERIDDFCNNKPYYNVFWYLNMYMMVKSGDSWYIKTV